MAKNDDLHPPGTTVAVNSGGSADQWRVGTYKGIDGLLHRVSFSASENDRYIEADRIHGPGQVYINRRGVAMEPMTFGEAIKLVHEFAPTLLDYFPDPTDLELSRELDWQRAALETTLFLVVKHNDQIDELYTPPITSGTWAEAEVGSRRDLDPDDPIDALRICVGIGETGIPDSSEFPTATAGIDRVRQAHDLVRDLIGAHGRDLASHIAVPAFK